ncbi:unnamed protein product [Cochlearia groenlandica]
MAYFITRLPAPVQKFVVDFLALCSDFPRKVNHYFFGKILPLTEIFSAFASVMAYIMTLKTIFYAKVPVQVRKFVVDFLYSRFRVLFLSSTMTVKIEDKNLSGSKNQFYDDVQEYIGSTKAIDVAKTTIKVTKEFESKNLRISIAEDEVVHDVFDGIKLEVKRIKVEKTDPTKIYGQDSFEIRFNEKHRNVIVNLYLLYVECKAAKLRNQNRSTAFYTHSDTSSKWEKIKIDNSSSFDTMAMDTNTKEG